MSEFLKGFVQGARETPRGYFAPIIAVWRVLFRITDDEVNHSRERGPRVA